MTRSSAPGVELVIPVSGDDDRWVLEEENMPETPLHERIIQVLVLVFTAAGLSFVLAWMRLSTGSVWPAIVLHAAWNAVIQGTFDVSTREPSIWVGETGLLVAAAALAVAWLLARKTYEARRAPGEAPFATIPGLAG